MAEIDRSALVLHSAEEMYRLVNDIRSYPSFLPWCSGAEVLSQTEDEMVARVDVAKAGLSYSFTTRNRLREPETIEMELVDGPFKVLRGHWGFKALSEEACKVSLQLSFDFSGKVAGLAMGKVFQQIAQAMVEAFCAQADKRYG